LDSAVAGLEAQRVLFDIQSALALPKMLLLDAHQDVALATTPDFGAPGLGLRQLVC